jgi:hypothetical protein
MLHFYANNRSAELDFNILQDINLCTGSRQVQCIYMYMYVWSSVFVIMTL